MNKIELKSIRLAQKDHFHFTNDCCICNKYNDDNNIVPILVDRLSGIEPKLYTEFDYACKDCLINKVGYFKNSFVSPEKL